MIIPNYAIAILLFALIIKIIFLEETYNARFCK